MSYDTCPLCGGNFRNGKTLFSAEIDKSIIIVRDVPAIICGSCGNKWFEDEIMKKLESVVQHAVDKNVDIEILWFTAA